MQYSGSGGGSGWWHPPTAATATVAGDPRVMAAPLPVPLPFARPQSSSAVRLAPDAGTAHLHVTSHHDLRPPPPLLLGAAAGVERAPEIQEPALADERRGDGTVAATPLPAPVLPPAPPAADTDTDTDARDGERGREGALAPATEAPTPINAATMAQARALGVDPDALLEFRSQVRTWAELDATITRLQAALKERRAEKARLQERIMRFMSSSKVHNVDVNSGRVRLRYRETYVRAPLSHQVIKDRIAQYFASNPGVAHALQSVVFMRERVERSALRKLGPPPTPPTTLSVPIGRST